MRSRFGVTALLSAAALVGVVATAEGQTRGIFQRISTVLRNEGYTRAVVPQNGWLDDREAETLTVWLTAGEQYAVAASCDEDCSDVDLQLFSPSGAEVARDLASDDAPVLFFVPRYSGRYEVRVSMASCSNEPCEYVAGVFKQ